MVMVMAMVMAMVMVMVTVMVMVMVSVKSCYGTGGPMFLIDAGSSVIF